MRRGIILSDILWALCICCASVQFAHSQSQTTTNKSAVSGNASREPTTTISETSQEVGEDDLVKIKTSLVTVPTIVMERSGKYVSNLRQEDFRVYEDGIEQQIAFFAPVEAPMTVALLLDVSDSTRFSIEGIQKAAIAFVERLRSDDRVIVVSFDENINVLAHVTSDKNVLRQAILRTRTGGGTRLYDAVDYAVNRLLIGVKGRKVVVLFSDGVDTVSRSISFSQSVHEVEESDVLIYPIRYDTYVDVNDSNIDYLSMNRTTPVMSSKRETVIPGRGSSLKDHQRGRAYLRELAQRTGAQLYQANDLKSLSQAFANIAQELRWHYSLGYYPKIQAEKGQRRQVRVRVNRPKVVVRARSNYISN